MLVRSHSACLTFNPIPHVFLFLWVFISFISFQFISHFFFLSPALSSLAFRHFTGYTRTFKSSTGDYVCLDSRQATARFTLTLFNGVGCTGTRTNLTYSASRPFCQNTVASSPSPFGVALYQTCTIDQFQNAYLNAYSDERCTLSSSFMFSTMPFTLDGTCRPMSSVIVANGTMFNYYRGTGTRRG